MIPLNKDCIINKYLPCRACTYYEVCKYFNELKIKNKEDKKK
jgi:hypothetical protein